MSRDEEALRRLVVELQLLEGTAEVLRSRIGLVNAAVTAFRAASSTLEGLKKEGKRASILVPIGGGSYVKARVADSRRLIIGIGADVAMEKSFDEARESFEMRILELEKARTSLQSQLEEAVADMNKTRNQIRALTEQRREGEGNVRRP